MPSPMAFNPPQPSSSLFSPGKKKSALGLRSGALNDAASYLSAVSQMDALSRGRAQAQTRGARSPSPAPSSTPALSFSSSATASSTDTEKADDEYYGELVVMNKADGLSIPTTPPTSSQVFTTVHSEFGHCANEDYRWYQSAHPGDRYDSHEQDPPYRILLTTYISYLLLICLGHMRDFFGKRFRSKNYKHLKERDVSDPLFHGPSASIDDSDVSIFSVVHCRATLH